MRRWMVLLILLLAGMALSGCAKTEKLAGYPAKPITILVAQPAGGLSDLAARIVAQPLSRKLGQPVVVINRSGGSGAMGMLEAANAKPDGYTLVMANPGDATIKWMLMDTGYTNQNFQPVAQITSTPSGLAVYPNGKFNTLAQMIDYAERNPGKLKVATSGATSPYQIKLAQLAQVRNLQISLIPFNGTTEAIAALLGNHVDAVLVNLPSLISQVKSKNLTLLGVAADERSPAFPTVPTFNEQSILFTCSTWQALLAPRATPPAVLQKLNDAIREVLSEEEVKQAFHQLNDSASYLNGEDFNKKWQDECNYYAKLLKK